MGYLVIVCYILFLIFEDGSQKPLGESNSHAEEVDRSGIGKRVRRSIPEFDAVNPLYSDYESLPDQEGSADPQRSGFALTDHITNIFRSQKSSKNNPKPAPKHASVDHAAVSLTKDLNSFDGEYLRTDEQEECYKQQNIALPAVKETSLKRCSGAIGKNKPEIADKQRPSYIRGNSLKDKSGKFYEVKDGEKTEITSLYSHPEKVFKPKMIRHYSPSISSNLFNTNGRVYKPTDIKAQFPIYDADLDFHPDPLQGILDDKYWVDSQEQEAVIRKYVDAAANIVPSDLKISKRSDLANQNREKNIDNQLYKKPSAVEEKCPCNQVVACGECSKGKQGKKTNITGSYEDGISYGRKLLAFDYENNIEESRNDGAREISSSEYENVDQPDRDGTNDETQIDEHIPCVTMNNDNVLEDNTMDKINFRNIKEAKDIIDNENFRLGRKLLWVSEFDESYEDTEDENEEYSDKNNPQISKDESYNDPKISNYQDNDLYLPASVYDTNEKSPTHDSFLNLRNGKIPNIHPEDEESKLYKPNKLANILQKHLQQKAKGPPKKVAINATLEFEKLANETINNITATEQATTLGQASSVGEIPTPEGKNSREQKKSFIKRRDDNPSLGYKGRRRHADHENTKHRLTALAQNDNSLGEIGSKETNNTTISTLSPAPTVTSTVIQANNATPVVYSKNVTNTTIKKTPNNTKSVEEGVEDAQVATNIVNSVLLESQKSSVVGHNLGLCRRNQSLVNVNYGKVIPETEKVLKTVTACIMDRLKDHLAKQSCIILDPELLEFLKWMILTGESYRDYKARLPGIYDFLPHHHVNHSGLTTCAPPQSTLPLCDPGMSNSLSSQSSVQMAIPSTTPGITSQQVL